jgi:hypothetical protein
MNEMTWDRIGNATMQWAPKRNTLYHILKVTTALTEPVELVTTYWVLKLTEKSWLHLGSADTFEEAKHIAGRDYEGAA